MQFFETLRSLGRSIGQGSIHHRQATVFEVASGHGSVLAQFRAKPGRWVLTIDTARYRCADCGEETSKYLQFMALEDGASVISECISNTFLEAHNAFTPDQEHALRTLGWSDPLPSQYPNWFFEATSNGDLVALSDMTYRTLREVLGLTDRDVVAVSFYQMIVAPSGSAPTARDSQRQGSSENP
jgi:hypothetical protein